MPIFMIDLSVFYSKYSSKIAKICGGLLLLRGSAEMGLENPPIIREDVSFDLIFFSLRDRSSGVRQRISRHDDYSTRIRQVYRPACRTRFFLILRKHEKVSIEKKHTGKRTHLLWRPSSSHDLYIGDYALLTQCGGIL